MADPWKFHFKIPQAKEAIHANVFAGVQEVFELDIKPEAQRGTPVKTGTNRRSIDTEVSDTPEGPKAELFTQSGYGGYLETGTRKMPARPYLYPAFIRFIGKLPEIIKGKLKTFHG